MHLGIAPGRASSRQSWRSNRIAPSHYLGRLRTVKLTADGACGSVECSLARDLPRLADALCWCRLRARCLASRVACG